MLIDGIPKKFFASKNGRDLFYLELTLEQEIGFINFNTSLPWSLLKEEKCLQLIGQIGRCDIPDPKRNALIAELLNHIQSLPSAAKYYFTDFVLDKSGHYLDFYDAVTTDLLRNKDFDDYTVFTSNINGFYFDYVKPVLEEELSKNTPVFLDKNTFEKLVSNKEVLAREYVNLYQENTQFFESIISKETEYDCFVMVVNSEVKLFFVRRRS